MGFAWALRHSVGIVVAAFHGLALQRVIWVALHELAHFVISPVFHVAAWGWLSQGFSRCSNRGRSPRLRLSFITEVGRQAFHGHGHEDAEILGGLRHGCFMKSFV